MGNPNVHDHVNLPILVAGGGAGRVKGGRHIKYAEPTPLANLHLTLLDKSASASTRSPTARARSMNCSRCELVASAALGLEAACSSTVSVLGCCLGQPAAAGAASRAPLADAAEKMDRASDSRAAEAARRRERAAGRRHDGAALGGLPGRSGDRRNCWSAPAPT